MAGNKINTKAKAKEDKGKSKSTGQSNEDPEDPDFSLLRKPILTSITGFGQARKIFDMATEELKNLLSDECDLLYECKVCRNIFRSLANFISHKRVYCKEKFNSTIHGHFIKATTTLSEMLKVKRVEDDYQESLKENNEPENIEIDECNERIPLTKDLTAIVEKIAKKKGTFELKSEEPKLALQKIQNTSVAVFQNVESTEEKQNDNMRVQVNELDNILSWHTAVLQSDGKFKIQKDISSDTDNVIQISDDEEHLSTDALRCKICDLQFATQKTLRFHMKYKHVESRLVYPCPDCLEIFSTSWSVYRHLFKVHRKTAAQIRRLRESIQAKAFKMNNPPAFYEKRRNNIKSATVHKISEEERREQENQAWMDNMEGDGELPRCGGCGRTFERRAALAAHTHICQPRSRALARRPPETKKIEIQIRKDYNKGPATNLNLPLKTTDANENKLPRDDPQLTNTPQKENDVVNGEDDKDEEDNTMDVSGDDQTSNDAADSPEKNDENIPQPDISKPVVRLPFAQQAEKTNLLALRQRIQSDIQLQKLLCKKCDSQFNHIQELYDHVAAHYKWMRYACKLCNYKHYYFEKLPEHVKIVHKLKGDKDFYFSTVKAISGPEALELSEAVEEPNEITEISPDSRRPSRCSSDSSRLSDDSSSSSTRVEIGSKKRKIYHNKVYAKKRKESVVKVCKVQKDDDLASEKDGNASIENDSSSNIRTFEENSSDMDDIRQTTEDTSSVASRRPVRRKAKPKNADFEYDLSNLLKMEAQGYRDSQSVTSSKSNQTKKKVQQEVQITNEIISKDFSGALLTLSKKAVERAAAHLKMTSFVIPGAQKEIKQSNIFVRPMIPKGIYRGEKISPKKDIIEDRNICSPNKDCTKVEELPKSIEKEDISVNSTSPNKDSKDETNDTSGTSKERNDTKKIVCETIKTNLNIPAVVPFKFRRQSLEVIKNPLINKNITDFSKAGMKTKILVIKPINRNKDGTQSVKTPLKFQTIKLKDPNKKSSNEDKSSDQVVVVKVPKVDCTIARPVADKSTISNEKCTIIDEKCTISNEKCLATTSALIAKDVEKTNFVEDAPTLTLEKCKEVTSDTKSNKSCETLVIAETECDKIETNVSASKTNVSLTEECIIKTDI